MLSLSFKSSCLEHVEATRMGFSLVFFAPGSIFALEYPQRQRTQTVYCLISQTICKLPRGKHCHSSKDLAWALLASIGVTCLNESTSDIEEGLE